MLGDEAAVQSCGDVGGGMGAQGEGDGEDTGDGVATAAVTRRELVGSDRGVWCSIAPVVVVGGRMQRRKKGPVEEETGRWAGRRRRKEIKMKEKIEKRRKGKGKRKGRSRAGPSGFRPRPHF